MDKNKSKLKAKGAANLSALIEIAAKEPTKNGLCSFACDASPLKAKAAIKRAGYTYDGFNTLKGKEREYHFRKKLGDSQSFYFIYESVYNPEDDEALAEDDKRYGVTTTKIWEGIGQAEFRVEGAKEDLERLKKDYDLEGEIKPIMGDSGKLEVPSDELLSYAEHKFDQIGFNWDKKGITPTKRVEYKLDSRLDDFHITDADAILNVYSSHLDALGKDLRAKGSGLTYNIGCDEDYHVSGYAHVDAVFKPAMADAGKPVLVYIEWDDIDKDHNFDDADFREDLAIAPEGWVSKETWEAFLEKAKWPYWNDWQTLVEEAKDADKKFVDTHDSKTEAFGEKYKGYIYHYDRRHPKTVDIYKDAKLVKQFDIDELKAKGDPEQLAKEWIDEQAKGSKPKGDAIVNPIGSLMYDEQLKDDIKDEIMSGPNAGMVGNIKRVFNKYGIKANRLNATSRVIEVDWVYKGFTGYNLITMDRLEGSVNHFAEDLAGAIYKKSMKHDSIGSDEMKFYVNAAKTIRENNPEASDEEVITRAFTALDIGHGAYSQEEIDAIDAAMREAIRHGLVEDSAGDVPLYYQDLEITVYGKYHSDHYDSWYGWEPGYYDEDEMTVDYEYEADYDSVVSVIADRVLDDEKYGEAANAAEEEGKLDEWIDDNFDELCEYFEEDLKEYFEDEAKEAASEYYSDMYNDPDYGRPEPDYDDF